MHRFHRVVSLILLLGCPALAVAGSSPEAGKYLSALTELALHQAFQVDYSLEATTSAMGQPVSVSMNGHMVQRDRDHMRATSTMNLTMKTSEPDRDVTMTMSSLVVADGSTMWTEVDNPMMGGKQVMKIGIDEIRGSDASADAGFQQQLAALDPLSQMRRLARLFDFEVADRGEGTVTLSAEVTQDGLAKMGITPDLASGVKAFVLILDEKTGFVKEVRIEGSEPVMVMRVTNFETIDAAGVDSNLFTYAPPDGVGVTDLGAMAGE